MKTSLFFLLLIFFFSACQITERVYVNEDGSIRYEGNFYSDQIEQMKMDSLAMNEGILDSLGKTEIDTIIPASEASSLGLVKENQKKDTSSAAYKRLMELEQET